jgi:class 3 adenylate cyclase
MLDFANVKFPFEDDFLVIFTDITGFGKIASKMNQHETFLFLDEFYSNVDEAVSDAGGYIVKFMGDSVLIIFSSSDTDAGMKSMYDLKKKYDEKSEKQGRDNRLSISAHFGKLVIGKLGKKDRIDILGDTVNTTVLLSRNRNVSGDFIISAQAYRSLSKETRELFTKNNLPVCYAIGKGGKQDD